MSSAPPHRLPFALQPPCTAQTSTNCLPASFRSTAWAAQLRPALPMASDAALTHACGPLRMHTIQEGGVRRAVVNASFWSGWLGTGPPASWRAKVGAAHPAAGNASFERRCTARLRGWRPRVCQLQNVYIAGAAQVIFNQSGYIGHAHRVTSTLRPEAAADHGRDRWRYQVEATLPHVVLSRNEYGAGFYHMLFDTLASLSYLWPVLRGDESARFLLNPCTTGRDHLQGARRASGGHVEGRHRGL